MLTDLSDEELIAELKKIGNGKMHSLNYKKLDDPVNARNYAHYMDAVEDIFEPAVALDKAFACGIEQLKATTQLIEAIKEKNAIDFSEPKTQDYNFRYMINKLSNLHRNMDPDLVVEAIDQLDNIKALKIHPRDKLDIVEKYCAGHARSWRENPEAAGKLNQLWNFLKGHKAESVESGKEYDAASPFFAQHAFDLIKYPIQNMIELASHFDTLKKIYPDDRTLYEKAKLLLAAKNDKIIGEWIENREAYREFMSDAPSLADALDKALLAVEDPKILSKLPEHFEAIRHICKEHSATADYVLLPLLNLENAGNIPVALHNINKILEKEGDMDIAIFMADIDIGLVDADKLFKAKSARAGDVKRDM